MQADGGEGWGDGNGWMELDREGGSVRKGGKERQIKWRVGTVKGESHFGKSKRNRER